MQKRKEIVMTRKCVTDDQYGQLQRRLGEVARRVDEGTLLLDATMDALQMLIEGRSENQMYPVIVNYDLSLRGMIRAGGYKWVNSSITAKNFPVEGDGQIYVTIELVHFDHSITSDKVLSELDKRGLRAATLSELLAFGATYPDVQREFPVFALGSMGQDRGGYCYVQHLWSDSDGRRLHSRWLGDGWLANNCRFAAGRKPR